MPSSAPVPRVGKLDPEGIPFVGGIPESTIADVTPAEINRYRPRTFSDRRKTEKTCTDAKDQKFKGFDDESASYTLMQFENYVSSHLQDTGMDSIFYFQTAADPRGDYYSIVSHHARFTEAQVKAKVEEIKALKDVYDLENLMMSRKFLQNAIHHDLEARITNGGTDLFYANNLGTSVRDV